ncbi:MAG: hypothetical protein ABL927_00970 [Bdellovibrionales bacterium]
MKNLKICRNTLKLTLFVSFVFSFCFSNAEEACIISVLVNNEESVVTLDGKKIGSAPLTIICSNHERLLEIESISGQKFNRTLPTKEFINDENRTIQVYFPGSLSVKNTNLESPATEQSVNGLLKSKYPAKNFSEQKDQLYSEIILIKKRLAALESKFNLEAPATVPGNDLALGANAKTDAKFNTPKVILPVAPIQVSENKRKSIAAEIAPALIIDDTVLKKNLLNGFLTRGIASLRAGFSSGYYVQLFTLQSKNYDMANIKKVLMGGESTVRGSLIKLCRWPNQDDFVAQVLVGPFENYTTAKSVKDFVKKDSFILRKNSCDPLIDDVVFQ